MFRRTAAPMARRVTDPGILREALLSCQLHHDVWTKLPDLKPALRIQLSLRRSSVAVVNRWTMAQSKNVPSGSVKSIGDGVPVVEAFHVRPVLLGIDRPALGCARCHLTVECLRQDLVEVTLVTGDSGAIGESNSDRRN